MPSADEQYELELINDARLDPTGNAYRYITGFDPIVGTEKLIDQAIQYFHVDGAAFLQALSAFPASQPLAFSDQLEASALAHDGAMIAANEQQHQLPGERDPSGRAQDAGYDSAYVGENIYAFAEDPLYAHAGFMIDYGFDAGGMQSGAGHRANILDPDYREVGIGIVDHTTPGGVGPELVTEDFGRPQDRSSIILGVAYADRDRNGFYTPGEGISGLAIAVGDSATRSDASGGYSLKTTATGRQTITLTGGGLSGEVDVTLDLTAAENVKLDIVDGDILRTSVPVQASGPLSRIVDIGPQGGASQLLGGTTGSGQDTVQATAEDDVLTGGDGPNRFVFQQDGSHDEIGNLRLVGDVVDTVDLSAFPRLQTFRQMMSWTADVDGQATIHLGPTTITLDGLSKAELRGHRDAFTFQA